MDNRFFETPLLLPHFHFRAVLHRLWFALAASTLLCLSGGAAAQLKVSESVIEMDSNQTRTNLVLSNLGGSAVQVSINLQQVMEPGSSYPINEVTTPAHAAVLTLEPSLADIPPGQSLSVEIKHTARKLTDDEVYRVLVTPTQTQAATDVNGDTNTRAGGMNIVLNYDLLLLIRPEHSTPDIRVSQTSDGIKLVNQGSTNTLLKSVQLCDESTGACHQLPAMRLYAKQHMDLTFPVDYTLEHTVVKTQQIQRKQSVLGVQKFPL